MTGGILHINGEAVKRSLQEDAEVDTGLFVRQAKIYIETLPEGREHLIQELSDQNSMDNTVPVKIPDGHYFFMGDNRDNSRDSRAEVGFVPAENLIGRAEFLFFSHNGTASIFEIWKWPFAIRFGRIGQGIE